MKIIGSDLKNIWTYCYLSWWFCLSIQEHVVLKSVHRSLSDLAYTHITRVYNFGHCCFQFWWLFITYFALCLFNFLVILKVSQFVYLKKVLWHCFLHFYGFFEVGISRVIFKYINITRVYVSGLVAFIFWWLFVLHFALHRFAYALSFYQFVSFPSFLFIGRYLSTHNNKSHLANCILCF